MKITKRIGILLIICILLFSIFTLGVCAEGEVDTTGQEVAETAEPELDKILGSDLALSERIEYALQGTVTGLLMVFAVLALLAVVVSLSKVVFYDIPRKRQQRAEKKAENEKETVVAEESVPTPAASAPAQTSDGELVAVITAAIAAAIQSGEYGDEFASGFRVVSFKRVNTTAWNKR